MASSTQELRNIAVELREQSQALKEPDIEDLLTAVEDSVRQASEAWSGSWIGYHAYVYYEGLAAPPPGAHFSSEWGLSHATPTGTHGEWVEYKPSDVKAIILKRAGNPDLALARKAAKQADNVFEKAKTRIISIFEIEKAERDDQFVSKHLEEVSAKETFAAESFVKYARPSGQIGSRDAIAMHQGLWTPPHIELLADVLAIRSAALGCEQLAGAAEAVADHLDRANRRAPRERQSGSNIFIGHGGSPIWKDLKDFLQDTLGLTWDEFNRVPVAGISNVARLSEMLGAARLAFLVLTAEDEVADGTRRARMNVIHETGLFQGRLGFERAIVLLEEGCEEFSNIEGIGQIRFPEGNIGAAFEEIRRVLEREGIIEQ